MRSINDVNKLPQHHDIKYQDFVRIVRIARAGRLFFFFFFGSNVSFGNAYSENIQGNNCDSDVN